MSLGAASGGVNVAADERGFAAYLIFDFGKERRAARAALAQVELWSQLFKLHGQLLAREKLAGESAQVVVCLKFEEFEKLAFERWLERIPREEMFACARQELIRSGDERFAWAGEWFGPV